MNFRPIDIATAKLWYMYVKNNCPIMPEEYERIKQVCTDLFIEGAAQGKVEAQTGETIEPEVTS